jgi:excisionase family DNA binding protein
MSGPKAQPLRLDFDLEELAEAIRGRLFLSVPEVADLYRVDQRTLRRAIEDNQVAAVRLGNTVRIPTVAFLRMAGFEPENETAPVGKTGAVALIKTPDTTSNSHPHDNDPSAA